MLNDQQTTPQIVILGAGYAGLRAALDLGAHIAEEPGLAQITLVDQNPYHQVVQMLHHTATDPAFNGKSAIPLTAILQHRSGIVLQQARVSALDLAARQVQTSAGPLSYDLLLLALGGHTHFGAVPGATEYTLTLRSYSDALRLRSHVLACFKRAAHEQEPRARRRLLAFAIVGGGYTGCQLAGELAVWLEQLCQQHAIARAEVRLALFQGGPLLLEQMGAWASVEAVRVLTERGVTIHLNTPVEQVEPGLLRFGGLSAGKVLRADTLVWAGGVCAPALIAEAGIACDERGRALVDQRLRVAGSPGLYACGDCAAVPAPAGGTVPATASYALRQGEYLALALPLTLRGQEPPPYEPLKLGDLVSLGPGYAVGNPLGAHLSGLPAALLKQGVEQWYRTTLQ